MDQPSKNGANDQNKRGASWLVLIEGAAALILAVIGLNFILRKEPESWTGFALLGIALLLYMLRGQVIVKGSIGKDGISWETLRAVKETAEEAKRTAETAIGVASQQVAGPPKAVAAAEEARPVETLVEDRKNGWAHPSLKPGKAPANDTQKNRWGGSAARNGRKLSARVTAVSKGWYKVVVTLSSTDPARPLTNRVRFHVHETFNPAVVTETPVDNAATWEQYAYGAFTVGAEVEHEPDSYFELDLSAPDIDAPQRFKDL